MQSFNFGENKYNKTAEYNSMQPQMSSVFIQSRLIKKNKYFSNQVTLTFNL